MIILTIFFSLLLHAKVKEYTQCHALASLWLRCEDNSYKSGYDRVVCLYIAHVMLPKGQLSLVPQFLNSCTYLKEQVKKLIFLKSEELVKSKIDENDNEVKVNNPVTLSNENDGEFSHDSNRTGGLTTELLFGVGHITKLLCPDMSSVIINIQIIFKFSCIDFPKY